MLHVSSSSYIDYLFITVGKAIVLHPYDADNEGEWFGSNLSYLKLSFD